MKSRFPLVEIRKLVDKASTPVDVDLDAEYVQIGIRSHGKGLFDKGAVSGKALGDKRVFWVEPDCFVVNIVFAWEQAVGKTSNADVGKIASHRFPMYRPKPGKADVDYLVYLFKTRLGKHLLTLASPGGAGRNKTLGQTEFSRIEIPCPPFAEQKHIAEILSTWDRAIETTEKLIANSEAQKKALMQQLLTGKKRLPGFSGEWQRIRLQDVGETSSGGTPESDNAEFWNGDIAWVTPTDITALKGRLITRTERYISSSGLANSSAKLLPAMSLLICTRATVGQAAISTKPMATNQGFKNIAPYPGYDVNFLYYLIALSKSTLVRASCGSTFLELSKIDFDNLIFSIPPIDEQIAIAAVLIGSDDQLELQLQSLLTLKLQKSALMQQLLTGKRRVKLNGEAQAA